MALGAILAGLGLSIAVPTLFQRNLEPVGRILMRDLKTVIAVFASILAFGFSVGLFGLLPATVVLTLVASRADGGLSLRGALILAAALSAVAVIVFRWGLGVPFVLFTWPW